MASGTRERTGLNNALPDGPLYVGMDGGYVRGREQGWFEAIAGKSLASFHRDGRDPDPSGRCFAFVQTVDDKPRARLVDTLRQQGMQPQQQVLFLSDGADALRRLQQNIALESEHVLDWHHVTMRLTVLGQMIKGAWADAVTVEAKAAALERIKWLLWHGNALTRSTTSNVWQTTLPALWRTTQLRHRCESLPPHSVSSPRISPTTWVTS